MSEDMNQYLADTFAAGILTAENALRLLQLNFGMDEEQALDAYAEWQLGQDPEYNRLLKQAKRIRKALEKLASAHTSLASEELKLITAVLTSDNYSDGSYKKARAKTERNELQTDTRKLELEAVLDEMALMKVDAVSRARKDLLAESG